MVNSRDSELKRKPAGSHIRYREQKLFEKLLSDKYHWENV